MGGAAVSRHTTTTTTTITTPSTEPTAPVAERNADQGEEKPGEDEHEKQQRSIVSKIFSRSSSAASEVDVDILYSALLKLTAIFEINESLMTGLTDEIVDPKHANFKEQFMAVEEWIMKHGDGYDIDMTGEEIDHLIQYVHLYQPLPEEDEGCDEAVGISGSGSYAESETTETSRGDCPLVCPPRHELAALTGDIRTQEAKKLNPFWHTPLDDTCNLRFSGSYSGRSPSFGGSHSRSSTDEGSPDSVDVLRLKVLRGFNDDEDDGEW